MTARSTIKTSRMILFTGWLLAGVCLLLLPPALTNTLCIGFRRAFRDPMQIGYSLPSLSTSQTLNPQADPVIMDKISELKQQVQAYKNHVNNLKADLAAERYTVQQLIGLKEQAILSGLERMTLIPARAIYAKEPGMLFINRGKRDTLQPGYFAIVNNAIIGQLAKVEPFDSQLLLITDKDSSLEAQIIPNQEGTPILAKLTGTGQGTMRMRINRKHKLNEGDPVHIPKNRYLDAPLIVGYIKSFDYDREEPLLWEVIIEPATSLDNIQNICVLGLKDE